MIVLLRAGSFLVNLALFAGAPYLLGLAWPWALLVAAALFLSSWWACGHVVARSAPASRVQEDAAHRAADRLGVAAPRFVRAVEGWTAAAVRCGRGYGILVGDDVAPEHHDAVLVHEIAHYATGDLFWEPFTDGPARLLVHAAHAVPPLGVIAIPFLLLGAPLARATELRADRLAAEAVPGYPAVLREVAARMEARGTFLYPSLGTRIRHSARDSDFAPPAV
ncbi:MAG: M48 family metalloprotease [Planctomycetota bacterium]|jgi:Zn-dependent protease with chaperone function